MDRRPVSSSNLKSVGYDKDSRILEIEFTSGAIYEYYRVPRLYHIGLMNAESKGQYFAEMIKPRWNKPSIDYKRIK